MSRQYKQYQFFEKEKKLNAMNCRIKTNKILTAVKEAGHTVSASEGETIHKKLASKPIKFQLSRRPEEQRKPTSRCRRCGKFSQGEYCDNHERVLGLSNSPQETSCSYTLPTMPQKRSMYSSDAFTSITETYDSQMTPYAEENGPGEEQTSIMEEPRTTAETMPEMTTPLPTTLIGCTTSHDPRPAQRDREQETTPIRATVTAEGAAETEAVNQEKGKIELKGWIVF